MSARIRGLPGAGTVTHVSRFTFAKGNAEKVLALPVYALGALASRLVPRKKDHWVFGCGSGVGEGALALYLHARETNTALRLTWLARTAADTRAAALHGIPTVPVMSWHGFWLTLRAEVLVVTHGFGDVNRFGTRGAFIVQLWHGIPLKLIHLDSPATLRSPILPNSPVVRRVLGILYRGAARAISLMPAASELSAARLRTAFALPADRVVVTGDPRDDVLFTGTAAERRTTARTLLADRLLHDDPTFAGFGLAKDAEDAADSAHLSGPTLILQAPTWRDGAIDPALPTAAEWQSISEYLERRKAHLVIRPHPLGAGDFGVGAALSPRIHLLTSALQPDVTPLLPAFDVLVTDYSSIAYDYALTGGDLLYLAPDVDAYSTSRGLYEPYSDFSGGFEVSTWDLLLDQLERRQTEPAFQQQLARHSAAVAARNHSFHDGRNTVRVYTEVTSRLEGTTMTPAPPLDASAGSASSFPSDSVATLSTLALSTPTATATPVSGGIATADPHLELAGTLRRDTLAAPLASAEAVLVGARLELAAPLSLDGNSFSTSIPLLASRWSGPLLAPPSGTYRLKIRLTDAAGTTRTHSLAAPPDAIAPLAALQLVPDLFVVSATTALDGAVSLVFGAPLAPDERGPAAQAKLEAAYRSAPFAPLNAVFFESFYGQNASCNPLAIDRELARTRPDVTRYWSVADASVAVPPGAIALVDGSAEWWRIRGSARVFVVNDWLRKRFRKRAGQTVLQTWHGTPLKRIALTRPGVRPRTAVATLLERSRWDILLAQNRYSTRIFRTAYAFLGAPWEEGYPRNDILVTGDATALRARLGIAPDTTVVLYAPTWRDDRPNDVDQLDVAAFSRELGPGFVTLLRGHSRSLKGGTDIHASNVIDVTTYPDASELFLVADALVTDYSSVMFDYSVTGKPIYFFTPDLERYRNEIRGFYFDLLAVSPGPVVRDAGDLIGHLRDPDAATARYASRYAAWRARFNPRDDGHAAERVVKRLLARGILD